MIDMSINNKSSERGIALVTALMATTMLLALGIAVVYSATTDTIITKSQRVGEQSFFVADAGIGIARRALAQAFSEEINKIRTGAYPFYSLPSGTPDVFPDVQVIPDPDVAPNDPFYQRVYARANDLIRIAARDQRLMELNGGSFTVGRAGATGFGPGTLSGTVSLAKTNKDNAVQIAVFRYAIQVTGQTAAGGSATVDETGRISTNITLKRQGTSPDRGFSFAGFGAFFDVGDDTNSLNQVLVPGTFSGPVHTNTHFAFYTGWQYTFRNLVSQVEPSFREWPNNYVPLPTSDYKGSIHLSKDGYKQTGYVSLPANDFSQQYAVINGTGITDKNADGTPLDPPAATPLDKNGSPLPIFDSQGRVTADALAANLRDTSNNQPIVKGNKLDDGVYIASANGSAISGAGIYVQGDASDIQLYADSSGNQVYAIQQVSSKGLTTTTVTVNYSNSTTTVSSGSSTVTYSGIPTDKSDPARPKPGVSLYVTGGINSLRGGKDSSSNRPAIASNTRLTITAGRSIRVTGDLKYADAVVNSDGTPISNISSVKNVLGLFTNDGNIYLDAKTAYVSNPDLSIEVDAANCVFNSDTKNDKDSPTGKEGGITTWFGSGHQTPSGSARIRLVGSDVEKNNSLVDYYNADTYFDVRFSGGAYGPPFFPGTKYDLGQAPTSGTPVIVAVDAPAATARSWFRENN